MSTRKKIIWCFRCLILDREQAVQKSFIEVDVHFRSDGVIVPVAIYWSGRRFTVDRLIDYRKSVSLCTGGGDYRYTCIINGKPRQLYREFDVIHDKYFWFVEEMVREPQEWAD